MELRRPVPRRLPGAAPPGSARQPRPGPAGLAGLGRLRQPRGPLAAPLGRGVPAVRGGGEARVAALAGGEAVPGGRLGRARRRPRRGARQLRAPLPHHLGHRPRAARTLPRPAGRPPRNRPDHPAHPVRRRGAAARGRPGHRGARQRARGRRHRPRRRLHPGDDRRIHPPRRSGAAGHRRDRRQRGAGATALARGAGQHAGDVRPRRARLRGRHRDAGRAARRRPLDPPGPHVALHRGDPQLGPGLARPRHPDPARPLLAVDRRPRRPPARPGLPRLRHHLDAAPPAHHRA